MIIYTDRYQIELCQFGIEIPLLDQRAKRTFQELQLYFGENKLKNIFYCGQTFWPKEEDLLLAHKKDYVKRLLSPEFEKEAILAYELINEDGTLNRYNPSKRKFPLVKLREKIFEQVACTIKTCELALENKFAYFLGGGMHHALPHKGRGFCLINDIVIAIRKLQNQKKVSSAWVIDLDAHKGDGTAYMTKDDQTISTLSIHMKSGWPLDDASLKKFGKNYSALVPSNIDIPIDTLEESGYNERLKHALLHLKQHYPQPELAIVISGSDPFEKDKLKSSSKLNLTKSQMLERDLIVYHFLKDLEIPQAYLMAGGYGPDNWEIHFEFLKYWINEKLYS